MKNQINIRKADETDFNSIYQFVNELEETVFGLENQKKAFEKNIKNESHIYLIAELNNKPIGFISCHSQNFLHHAGQKIAEIQEMYVIPEKRKIGVGKRLVDELKRIAKKMELYNWK